MPDNIPAATPGLTPTIPPSGKKSVINIDLIRQFIYDRRPSDNPLLLDIEYSDDEIMNAQFLAAMYYNDEQPRVITIDPAAIPPGFFSIMIYGIAYYLLNGKILQLERNNVDYEAGNMTVNINKERINALRVQVPRFFAEFQRQVASDKRSRNVAAGFRRLGGGWGNSYGGW